jgi:hypothetical protein
MPIDAISAPMELTNTSTGEPFQAFLPGNARQMAFCELRIDIDILLRTEFQ